MKKIIFFKAVAVSLFLCHSAYGQEIPNGQIVRSLDCSLNDGVSMQDAIEWARNEPRDPDVSPGAIFFRQAIFAGSYRANYDFRIALYYPSYAEMDSRVAAGNARPANRVRHTTMGGVERSEELYENLLVCDSPRVYTMTPARVVQPQ